eukprot:1215710-Rhodomonas_salina.1
MSASVWCSTRTILSARFALRGAEVGAGAGRTCLRGWTTSRRCPRTRISTRMTSILMTSCKREAEVLGPSARERSVERRRGEERWTQTGDAR